jgi:hypothetical protein
MAMNGWDRFAMGGVSTGRKMGGLTMVRKRPTRRKRRPGDIWAQLSVSACVLLLPPLVMAAGVMVFGSSSPPGQQVAVQEAAAPQAAAANALASPAQRSFDLASAETRPVISEKGPIAGPRPASERPTVAAPRAPIGQAAGAKDTTRYSGAPPVTLANIGKASEQSAIAAVEAPSPAAAAGDARAAVPEDTPAATRIHSSRNRSRMGRQEPRPVYRGRYQRSRSLSDIFARSGRPRRG